MGNWLFSGISIEVADQDLVLRSTNTTSKLLIGSSARIIKLAEITGLELTNASTLSSGAIVIADRSGKTSLPFPESQKQDADDLYFVLSKIAPSAGSIHSSVPIWTDKGDDRVMGALNKFGITSERVSSLSNFVAGLGGASSQKASNKEVPQNKTQGSSRPSITPEQVSKPSVEKPEKPMKEKRGKVLAQGAVGHNIVTIYENGYVKVGAKTERLLAISGNAEVSKKSGVGRSVATAATLLTPFPGFNLLSSSNRGDVYLAITTDRKTYMLKGLPDTGTIKALHGLVAAGTAVLEMRKSQSQIPGQPQQIVNVAPASLDFSEQLKNLSELHSAGALTAEEFAAAKAKLLGS